MSENKDPATQFQVGDRVLYLPEGIFAVVEGYVWNQQTGDLPKVMLYRLNIGIDVPASAIKWSAKP